jgi:hypothetical protein
VRRGGEEKHGGERQREAACQEASHSTPSAPAARSMSSEAKRTMRTTMLLPASYDS